MIDDPGQHRIEHLCNEARASLSTVYKMLEERRRKATGQDNKDHITVIKTWVTRVTNMVYNMEDIMIGGTGGFCSICKDFNDAADECYTDDDGLVRCTNKECM